MSVNIQSLLIHQLPTSTPLSGFQVNFDLLNECSSSISPCGHQSFLRFLYQMFATSEI